MEKEKRARPASKAAGGESFFDERAEETARPVAPLGPARAGRARIRSNRGEYRPLALYRLCPGYASGITPRS